MWRWVRIWCGLSFVFVGVITPAAAQSDNLDVLNTQVAQLYQAGRYDEAANIAQQIVGLTEKRFGPENNETAGALYRMGSILSAQGRWADAEAATKRAVDIYRRINVAPHKDLPSAISNLARIYTETDRFREAETSYLEAIGLDEQMRSPGSPARITTKLNLGALYDAEGDFAGAERQYTAVLGEAERWLDSADPIISSILANLAELYRHQRRFDLAGQYAKRALDISIASLGPKHPIVVTRRNNFGLILSEMGHQADAEEELRLAAAAAQAAFGEKHQIFANTILNLAGVLTDVGKLDEAEFLALAAFSILSEANLKYHPDAGRAFLTLGEVYRRKRQFEKSEQYYASGLWNLSQALGPDHPDTIIAQLSSSALYADQERWAQAYKIINDATRAIERRERHLGQDAPSVRRGILYSGTWQAGPTYKRLVKIAYRATNADIKLKTEALPGVFISAQRVLDGETSEALGAMAIRHGAATDALARTLREKQDLNMEWRALDGRLSAGRAAPPVERTATYKSAIVSRLEAVNERLGQIDKTLAEAFPHYATLASPEPLPITDVQGLLNDSETLILFLDTPEDKPIPEETFIWAVTKTISRWVRIDLGTKALAERVAALRCGLDSSNWIDASKWPDTQEDARRRKSEQMARRDACQRLTGADVSDTSFPPFDVAKAHELYEALFDQIADLLKNPDGSGRQLLIVPSGPLTQLPFHVLVTSAPNSSLTGTAAYLSAAWLAKRNGITVLPAVSSLKALRAFAKESHASKPFIGIGNPLLEGEDASFAPLAEAARARQQCHQVVQSIAGLRTARGGMAPLERVDGIADVALVRAQTPLPETADELCAVGHDLGAGDGDIYLGASASETGVKALSASGALAQYRIVHFATHGALAGQMKGSAEPGLLLTPPDQGTEEDDGYLSASEVAGLKLDADWVILSACNTAGGAAEGAEALSGLARAFFYAGARALLVSHWPVNSHAAAVLTTRSFAEMAKDPRIGRAEALRRAMLALMSDQQRPWASHPSVWAPFVVIGEGGAPTNIATAAPLPNAAPTTIVGVPTNPKSADLANTAPRKKMQRKPASGGGWFSNIFGQ